MAPQAFISLDNNTQQIQAIPEYKTTKSKDLKAKHILTSFSLSNPNSHIFEKRAELHDKVKTELKTKFSKKSIMLSPLVIRVATAKMDNGWTIAT